jgi:ABC-2 type transport system ATP-binding protein
MRLELKDIYKSFGEKQVLKGISLQAESGSALGILGRNGAGKTTTIRILLDVFPSDRGEVLIDGKPIDREKIRFGYLPEERGLYPKKKIADQLSYFAQLKGMSSRQAAKAIDVWLEKLGMSEYKDKKLDTLSKGNQQKIQLITAVIHDPDIVILDEPFSGLDPVNAMMLEDVVKEEMARGKIVLFSSHQMNYIEEFCDNIAILNGGEIVLQGKLSEIKHHYSRDKLVIRSEETEKIMRAYPEYCEKTGENELLMHLTSTEEKQKRMAELTEQFDVDEVKVYEPKLSDIFVEYAGNQE